MCKLVDRKIFGKKLSDICVQVLEDTTVAGILLAAAYVAHKLMLVL